MKLKLIAAAIAALFAAPSDSRPRKFLGRRRFVDSDPMVFTGRMPGGIAGDVARFHPVGIEPCKTNITNPPTQYGVPVVAVAATNDVRGVIAADQADVTTMDPYGFDVRPFPGQQQSGNLTTTFGSGTPPTSGEIDIQRQGYIMAKMATVAAVHKGDSVFVWCTATVAGHVQGGVEGAFSAGNTVKLGPRWSFNGPADPDGNVEICNNV